MPSAVSAILDAISLVVEVYTTYHYTGYHSAVTTVSIFATGLHVILFLIGLLSNMTELEEGERQRWLCGIDIMTCALTCGIVHFRNFTDCKLFNELFANGPSCGHISMAKNAVSFLSFFLLHNERVKKEEKVQVIMRYLGGGLAIVHLVSFWKMKTKCQPW